MAPSTLRFSWIVATMDNHSLTPVARTPRQQSWRKRLGAYTEQRSFLKAYLQMIGAYPYLRIVGRVATPVARLATESHAGSP